MKIAVIGPSYPFKGGISHYNTLLCRELSKKHHIKLINYIKRYPSFLYPGETQIDRSKNKISFPGIRKINMVNPITWVKSFRVIKKFKPKIVIMYWYSPLFSPLFSSINFLIKKFTRTNIVIFCHNTIPPEKRPFDYFFERLFFRYVDFLIVATRYDFNYLKVKYPQHKISISPHPNYDIFDYGRFDKNSAKKKLGIKGKCILVFGYMRKYKGLENMLKAMPFILKKQEVKLIIAGEFWGDLNKYKLTAERLGINHNVLFVNRYINNEEVEIFFKASDIVIAPYLSHTNSGVIQLAFSFNKPVIATDVGSFKEVIGNKGYITKNNPKDIAEEVIHFYKSKAKKRLVNNIKNNKVNSSWSKLINTIENLKIENKQKQKVL